MTTATERKMRFCLEVPDNLALSILVQMKAFELGYRWIASGQEVDSSVVSYLIYFYEDGTMTYSGIRGTFERTPAEDFLNANN